MQWDGDFVDKTGAEVFDGALGGEIAGVAGDDDGVVKIADEGGEGEAGLPGVAMAAKGFADFKADVAGADQDVVGIADAKIDMAGVSAIRGNDAEMVGGDDTGGGVAGGEADEAQVYLVVGQGVRRGWEGVDFGGAAQARVC